MDNAYYYLLKAMCVALTNSNDMPFVHTIREIIEVSHYDAERIASKNIKIIDTIKKGIIIVINFLK